MRALIAWLAGSRFGRWLAAAVAAVAVVLAIRADAWRDGRREGRRRHDEADRKRATEVRRRAAAARERFDAGDDPDKRLRDHGRLRD